MIKRNARNATLVLILTFIPLIGFAVEDDPPAKVGERGAARVETAKRADADETIVALTYSLEVREDEQWKRFTKDELSKRDFELGDFFRLAVDPVVDCHVYVFSQVGDGPAACIYPEDGRQVKLTGGSGEYLIPDPEPESQRERFFEFSPPAGSEQLYVVATTRAVMNRDALGRIVSRKPEEGSPTEEGAQSDVAAQPGKAPSAGEAPPAGKGAPPKASRSQSARRARRQLGVRGAGNAYTGEARRLTSNGDVFSDGIGFQTKADRNAEPERE